MGFVWVTFMVLWRLDAGYSNLIAICFVLLVILISKKEKGLAKKTALSVIVYALVLAVVVFSIALIRGNELISIIRQALHYFGADQAHGAISMGQTQDRLFLFHYVLFPAIILFMGLHLLLAKRKYYSKHAFLFLSILFLIVFYFANLPRGLVRHGFNDQSDYWITSFSYLIFGLFTYLFWVRNKSPVLVKWH